jgi:short-subunit dehydrogenase
VRVALFNAGFAVWKPFLQLTEEEIDRVADTNVKAAFAFAREAIDAFRGQVVEEAGERGKRGTLLFTGATASLRGNATTASFSAAKFALRSLSQSLNKEFGKENIHVRAFLRVVCSPLIDPSQGGTCTSRSSSILFPSTLRLLMLSRTHSQVVIDGGTSISYNSP